MTIYIGGELIVQPSTLTEKDVQIQSENTSIDGTVQRNRLGQKNVVEMEWEWLPPSGLRQLRTLMTTGSGVPYRNDQSAKSSDGILVFSGLPYYEEGKYVPGASLFKDFRASIREI